jgi:hypothetical protein
MILRNASCAYMYFENPIYHPLELTDFHTF